MVPRLDLRCSLQPPYAIGRAAHGVVGAALCLGGAAHGLGGVGGDARGLGVAAVSLAEPPLGFGGVLPTTSAEASTRLPDPPMSRVGMRCFESVALEIVGALEAKNE